LKKQNVLQIAVVYHNISSLQSQQSANRRIPSSFEFRQFSKSNSLLEIQRESCYIRVLKFHRAVKEKRKESKHNIRGSSV